MQMQDYSVKPLDVGFSTGEDRLLLWLPMTMTHVIDEDSPLSNWKDPEDALKDADATIVVLVSPTLLSVKQIHETCACSIWQMQLPLHVL